jgi:hypothetical protein
VGQDVDGLGVSEHTDNLTGQQVSPVGHRPNRVGGHRLDMYTWKCLLKMPCDPVEVLDRPEPVESEHAGNQDDIGHVERPDSATDPPLTTSIHARRRLTVAVW